MSNINETPTSTNVIANHVPASAPDICDVMHSETWDMQDTPYTLQGLKFPYDPQHPNRRVAPSTLAYVEKEFSTGFDSLFTEVWASKGAAIYGDMYKSIMFRLYEEEAYGILFSGDKAVHPHYYDELNSRVSQALAQRQDPDTGRYGGYSEVQIAADISAAVTEQHGVNDADKHPYRLQGMSKQIIMIISGAFAAYRKTTSAQYIAAVDSSRYIPLALRDNESHPDPLLAENYRGRQVCGLPVARGGKYLSFPVAEGTYITSPEQADNVQAMLAAIADGYASGGGYSVLFRAGTGQGKTFGVCKSLAGQLGEITGAHVYVLSPTRALVGQLKTEYSVDVCYADDSIEREGTNPNLRAYIYEYVCRIPSVSQTEASQANLPVILIIDEVHFLLTEKYRYLSLQLIVSKAREILSAGGVVIGMTASTESLSLTAPYNNLSGYDLIVHAYRVSSTKDIITPSGVKPYPTYSYRDVAEYGPASGVYIESCIPADTIVVNYVHHRDPNMLTAATALLRDKLKGGHKLIMEYNNTDFLLKIKNILEGDGYKAVVCSAFDKEYAYSDQLKRKKYLNEVLDTVVTDGSIDFSDIDVVLTTKLLEAGTSINKILVSGVSSARLDEMRHQLTTIYVVDKRSRMSLEEFEQFSGRVRFRHDEAILLTFPPMPDRQQNKRRSNSERLSQKIKQIKHIAWKLKKNVISLYRLSFADYLGQEDRPTGMMDDGLVTSQVIAEAQYEAVKETYAALMYDAERFETVVRERYPTKHVQIKMLPPSVTKVSTKRESVDPRAITTLRDALDHDMAEYTRGDSGTESSRHTSTATSTALSSIGRASYSEPITKTMQTISLLETIDRITQEYSTSGFKAPNLPESFVGVNKKEIFISAATAPTKQVANRLYHDSIVTGMQYLSQFDLTRPLTEYALRYGVKQSTGQSLEDLVNTAVSLLPKMNKQLSASIRELMTKIFTSHEMIRACEVVRICHAYMEINMAFYCKLISYSAAEIRHLKIVYQAAIFAQYPALIHARDTRSGASFAGLTGESAYLAATGNHMDTTYGLQNWINKRITAERAEAIYTAYVKHMIAAGYCPLRDRREGVLVVWQTFATIFMLTLKHTKDGTPYVIIDGLRQNIPRDCDKFINFANTMISRS